MEEETNTTTITDTGVVSDKGEGAVDEEDRVESLIKNENDNDEEYSDEDDLFVDAHDDIVNDDDDDDDMLEHISEREDHLDHEIQVLHNMLPLSSENSPPSKRMSRKFSRRLSAALQDEDEDNIPAMELANSAKFNSTSTLFVDSTVTQPDLEEVLRCVALALSYVIQDGHSHEDPLLFLEKFDEKLMYKKGGKIRKNYATKIPSEAKIFSFLCKMFHKAELTAEVAIIALVYVNRVIAYADLSLQAATWKRVVLGAVLMASKVWDDQAVWNVDFCAILPKVELEDMNDLERTFLQLLDFNIDVDAVVYAKYYFELRSLAEKFDKQFPLEPLSTDSAEKLEAFSQHQRQDRAKALKRHTQSLDGDAFASKAVLS
eukprot:m.165908 g.165908  ORF g.165908 m.165908 type:complete len:374 (+) comp13441_c3_seq15:42-1163(+)